MSRSSKKKDLIVIAADKNIEQSLLGILNRPESLGIREIELNIQHDAIRTDPGCLNHSHDLLKIYLHTHHHALVVFDRIGCGKEHLSRDELETEVEERLRKSGWEDRAAAVVIDPELEAWVWSDSPHVARILGWNDRTPDLEAWLIENGYKIPGAAKPDDPKAAVEKALRIVKKPRSSSRYNQLARSVGFGRCQDPAFLKLKSTLGFWFGRSDSAKPR